MKLASLAFTASLVVFLSACGKQEQAAAPAAPAEAPAAPQATAPEAAPTMAANEQGKSVYNKTCALCHDVGAAGAPKPGDKADWEPRIAQGADVLYKHAIEGYTGSKGEMPARGGAATLPDDDVKAAVDYMVEQSK